MVWLETTIKMSRRQPLDTLEWTSHTKALSVKSVPHQIVTETVCVKILRTDAHLLTKIHCHIGNGLKKCCEQTPMPPPLLPRDGFACTTYSCCSTRLMGSWKYWSEMRRASWKKLAIILSINRFHNKWNLKLKIQVPLFLLFCSLGWGMYSNKTWIHHSHVYPVSEICDFNTNSTNSSTTNH